MAEPEKQLFILLVVLAVIGLAYRRQRWRGSGTAHGTAALATEKQCREKGMLEKGDGLILGWTRSGKLLRMFRTVHLAIFSPAGGGKTVSFSTVWLLTKRIGSMVVLDVKGELYRLTAAARRAMGHTIIRLDPFKTCGDDPDTFNPLDLIDDEGVDDARALAEAMVIRTAEEKDPYWGDQSANLLTFCISFIVSHLRREERSLSSLRELLCQADLCRGAVVAMTEKGGIYARLAGVVAQLQDKEKAGVFSTANRHTSFADSNAILESVSSTSFNPRQLLDGNMTIYIILPPHQLFAQARWCRLVISSLIRLIGREGAQEN
jgi:type IV secretion system protein VirD4